MNVRKFVLEAAAGVVVFAAMASPAFAQAPQLNWGRELTPMKCGERVGRPVINVVEHVKNTVDSGEAGNYWAYDYTNRSIQVWDQGKGTYCVIVRNEGRFDAQAGQTSPGNTGTLDGSEDGVFAGGYRAFITGTLRSDPAWKTHGFVGVTDYQCDLTGNCPGYINWVNQYFEKGNKFTYDWWGWIYYSGHNRVWVNASTGNSGDIL